MRAIVYEFNGKSATLKEWAEYTDIPSHILRYRLGKGGWPLEKALTLPVGESLYGNEQKFTSVDSWDEPLAAKQIQVRLPQSDDTLLRQMDSGERAAWLRRVIHTALHS
jgi:hypothetical protein